MVFFYSGIFWNYFELDFLGLSFKYQSGMNFHDESGASSVKEILSAPGFHSKRYITLKYGTVYSR